MNEKLTQTIDSALASLCQSLDAGHSGQLSTYLAFMARFHQYSFNNVLLIAWQRPDSTQVAGYRKWQEFGRQVKKGEKGIAIMVPLVYRKKEQKAIVEEPEETVLGFRTGHIFDIEQTEGDPVPEFAAVKGDPGCYLMALHDFARDQGITVGHANSLQGARGLSHGGAIQLLSGLPEPDEFQVLAHELGHELLHKGDRRKETTKQVREAEAEAVAFTVCCAIGLEPGTSSADYIHLYEGDSKLLQESLSHIQNCAKSIIGALL